MSALVDYPRIFFVCSFVTLWLSGMTGVFFLKRLRPLPPEDQDDFGIIQGAALTLLGLLIGFTFSMSVSRFDHRKNLEEGEANAIGTEYVRAGLMPAADTALLRKRLKDYLDQRILFYSTGDKQILRQNEIKESQLQSDLWAVVEAGARFNRHQ